MPRLWLLGLGFAFVACLSIEEARTGTEDDGGGGSSSGGAGEGGPDAVSGGSWSGDSALDAPADSPSDVVADGWDGNPCSPDNPKLIDDFSQPDGPLGSGWSGDTNAFAIVGGQLRHTKANQEDRILFAKKLCATQTVSLRLMKTDPGSGLVGVLFAASSDNNCNLIQIGHSGFYQGVFAQKCWNGKWTDVLKKPWQVLDGDHLEARLTAAGDLTVLVNGVVVGSANVGVWPASYPGIAMYYASTQVLVDELKGG